MSHSFDSATPTSNNANNNVETLLTPSRNIRIESIDDNVSSQSHRMSDRASKINEKSYQRGSNKVDSQERTNKNKSLQKNALVAGFLSVLMSTGLTIPGCVIACLLVIGCLIYFFRCGDKSQACSYLVGVLSGLFVSAGITAVLVAALGPMWADFATITLFRFLDSAGALALEGAAELFHIAGGWLVAVGLIIFFVILYSIYNPPKPLPFYGNTNSYDGTNHSEPESTKDKDTVISDAQSQIIVTNTDLNGSEDKSLNLVEES